MQRTLLGQDAITVRWLYVSLSLFSRHHVLTYSKMPPPKAVAGPFLGTSEEGRDSMDHINLTTFLTLGMGFSDQHFHTSPPC